MSRFNDIDLAIEPGATAAGQRQLQVGVQGVYTQWVQRYSTRRALLALSEQHLRDIGLSREQAVAEGSKPFWKA
ncbi:DUF1127 domain-containing protein [Pseudomonas cremoricolorata]|uniref:YjiS-like domain-containing protein n=1 Tax=Pseudomonas cremoricolorata TaxID=157783 RepID=A0A089YAA2_9PSED|nr:DUF1127 domain-containing protein [Pseudomonas cremoricolorata]AIR88743.1 hypothetical protein LK03_05455 [Pseudomonas cremoricolorata]